MNFFVVIVWMMALVMIMIVTATVIFLRMSYVPIFAMEDLSMSNDCFGVGDDSPWY